MSENNNGSWRTWALGALLAIILLMFSGSGWLYADLSGRVSLLREVDTAYAERISRLEEQYKFIKESLDRIEHKLDKK